MSAAFEHNWNPHWKTSLYGGYGEFNYNDTANAILCAKAGILTAAPTSAAGCNNDFSYWNIGSRTQWTINNGLYIGLDVVYEKLNTASGGFTTGVAGLNAQPATARTIADQDAWIGQLRIHRDFYP